MRLYVYKWHIDPGGPSKLLHDYISSYAPHNTTHMVEIHFFTTPAPLRGEHYVHQGTYDEDHPAFQELMTLVLLGHATLTKLEDRG
jgi:hypothetical protein